MKPAQSQEPEQQWPDEPRIIVDVAVLEQTTNPKVKGAYVNGLDQMRAQRWAKAARCLRDGVEGASPDEARALQSLHAEALLRGGRAAEALPFLTALLEDAQKSQDLRNQARMMCNLAAVRLETGELDTPRHLLEHAHHIGQALPSSEIVAFAIYNQAVLAVKEARFDDANELFDKAMQVCTGAADNSLVTRVFFGSDMDDETVEATLAEQGIPLFPPGSTDARLLQLMAKARVQLDQGRPDKARPLYDSLLAQARAAGDDDLVASALDGLISVCAKQGQNDEAIKHALEVTSMRRKSGRLRRLVAELRALARLYNKVGNTEEALCRSIEGYRVCQEMENLELSRRAAAEVIVYAVLLGSSKRMHEVCIRRGLGMDEMKRVMEDADVWFKEQGMDPDDGAPAPGQEPEPNDDEDDDKPWLPSPPEPGP